MTANLKRFDDFYAFILYIRHQSQKANRRLTCGPLSGITDTLRINPCNFCNLLNFEYGTKPYCNSKN